MRVRFFAMFAGFALTVVGILGFVPALLGQPGSGRGLLVDAAYGDLMGLFPVNALSSLLHLVFGLWGFSAFRDFARARSYTRTVALVFGVLAAMGLAPLLDSFFGLMPLFGTAIWLHGLVALIAAAIGFMPERLARDGEGWAGHP